MGGLVFFPDCELSTSRHLSPLAGEALADLGADVVKIEPPIRGGDAGGRLRGRSR
jgi:crotonobetainyl-CoA:carnitine CoA-transferase CaiB-like acyl-CoA transferase